MELCEVDGCGRPLLCKGVCRRHYDNRRRYGQDEPPPRRSFVERVWSKIDRSGGERPPERPELSPCWPWTGVRNVGNGYGYLDNVPAHRVVYELLVEPIPSGLEIDHLCRVRHCVNPTHLEPVTPAVNIQRTPRVAAPAPCPHGDVKSRCKPCHAADARASYHRRRAAT